MIIGVDAGALSITDERLKVGVYRVTYNLLKELASIDTKNAYRLFSFLPIDRGVMAQFGSNMTNVVLRPTTGWSTFRLPLELQLHPVAIFLGLSQSLPSSPSLMRTIGFIYDLGFLYRPQDYPGSAQKLTKQTKELVGRADQIITISHASAADVVYHFGIPKRNITVAYPGVDERFGPRGPVLKRNNPYFLFVGSLKPGKNVAGILRAFAQFLKHCKKPYDLLLVGSNFWFDQAITQTIAELGIGSRVSQVGFVTDEELSRYYRSATAFVSPSYREGFCLPAVEAQACGCPVVVANTGVFPEVIGKTGIITDPNDIHTLSLALSRLSDNPALRRDLGRKGIANAKRFSWKHLAQIVLTVIGRAS